MKISVAPRGILTRELTLGIALTRAIGVFCFILLTAIGAYVRIPLAFTPVPITLQTFFVLLSGAVLGRRLGPLSQAGYLLLGALGLPVFSPIGLGLCGPTGGYLLGFMAASWIVAQVLDKRSQRDIPTLSAAMILGTFLGIYLFGVLGLSLYLHSGLIKAAALGILPFLPGDALKIILAVYIAGRIGPRSREIFAN